jgi:hypothetical protein
MRAYPKIAAVVALAAGAAACDTTTAPPDGRSEIGIIEWRATSVSTFAANAGFGVEDPYDLPVLVAPDTVQAGVPFDAVVTTIGASGCWRAAGARLAASPALAVITPYDVAPTHHANGEPLFCTGALVRLSRSVQLTFGQRGEATIRVEGRVVQDGDLARSVPGSSEKRVVVR